MEDKHPVSFLQELMVKENKCLPKYEITDISGMGIPTFQCTINVDDFTSTAIGPSKQEAKRKAAIKALNYMGRVPLCEEFNSANKINSSSDFITNNSNPIGKLNEYTAKKGLGYPAYQEQGKNQKNEFVIQCCFLHLVSEGCGSTKKAAKALAARNMLKLVEDSNLPSIDQLPIDNVNANDDKTVLEKFQKFTLSKIVTAAESTLSENVMLKPINAVKLEDKISSVTVDEAQEALDKYNVPYKIEILSKEPCVLMLKFNNDQNTTVVESGKTYIEAQNKLILKALTVIQGC